MRLRVFSSLIIASSVLFFAPLSFSQTEDMLNKELGAAEGAAGGEKSGPKELKSDGDTLDAVGIPSETGSNSTLQSPSAPPSQQQDVTKQEPPPPTVEEVPAPEVAEPTAPTGPTEEPKQESNESASVSTEEEEAKPVIAAGKSQAKKICNCKYDSDVPYRDRRSPISGFFGFEGGTYSPTNYIPAITSNQTFANYYASGGTPNIEVVFGSKWNFVLGSIGLQLTGGYYGANSANGSTMTVYPITGGLIYALDSIFKEPYVVPYVVGGMYTDFYGEKSQGLSVNGRTSFAPFYALGLMFQLDWIDPETHQSGYEDFGLENTFLFVEARSFLSSNDFPTDLSTPLQVSGGLRFEF